MFLECLLIGIFRYIETLRYYIAPIGWFDLIPLRDKFRSKEKNLHYAAVDELVACFVRLSQHSSVGIQPKKNECSRYFVRILFRITFRWIRSWILIMPDGWLCTSFGSSNIWHSFPGSLHGCNIYFKFLGFE